MIDLSNYGAKGANLKYISEHLPELPIPPYVLIPIGADWIEYLEEIKDLGQALVRSSSPVEDGNRISFAGLFNTTFFNGEKSIREVRKAIEHYQKIEQLEEYKDNYSYQMEFGVSPLAIFQWRPFRRKERAEWKISSDEDCDSYFVFGITPSEGIELTVARTRDITPILEKMNQESSSLETAFLTSFPTPGPNCLDNSDKGCPLHFNSNSL